MGFGCSGFGWGGWLPWGGSMWGFAVLFGVLVVLGLAVTLVLRRACLRTPAAKAAADPIEIAKRRLASGELSVAEYEEIRGAVER